MLSKRSLSKFAVAITTCAICATAGVTFGVTYNSNYYSDDGTSINEQNVTVVLNNGSGYYILPEDQSQGQLFFTITAVPGPTVPGKPIPVNKVYNGTWSYQGDTGTFTFTTQSNGQTFTGVWTDSGSGLTGQWTGYLGSAPLPYQGHP